MVSSAGGGVMAAPSPSAGPATADGLPAPSKLGKRAGKRDMPGLNRKKSKVADANAPVALAMTTNKAQSSPAYTRGMYLAFVDNALAEKQKGRHERYNELVSQFRSFSSSLANSAAASTSSTPGPSVAQIQSLTETLTSSVAQLDRSHSSLVNAVITMPWTAMQDSFAAAYMRFVQTLLCSRSDFVQTVLDNIVKGLRFQSMFALAEETTRVTKRQSYERLHDLLSSLIYLIPTLPTALWPVVNRYFPHKREPRNAQVVYIHNTVRIIEYCPQLCENILSAVIVRAIQIDTEIQIDVEDLEDEEGQLDEEVFGFSIDNPLDKLVNEEDSDSDSDEEPGTMDPDAISSDEGSSTEDEAEENVGQQQPAISPKVIKRLKTMAAKLDAILRVIFDFLQRLNASSAPPHFRLGNTADDAAAPRFSPDLQELVTHNEDTLSTPSQLLSQEEHGTSRLTAENGALLRRNIFDVLLFIFDEKILKTFKTRHTQFLLFWYSSLSPEYTDFFTGNLTGRALDEKDTPPITRVAAAGYVASYVARALSIDRMGARRVISLLCANIDNEMHQVRLAAMVGNVDEGIVRKGVSFYALCQAVFYIFCFRWKDLLDDSEEELEAMDDVPSGRRWQPDLEILKEAVGSPLNPLKLCSPTVVAQFARVAHKTDFMYCYNIIEANKRSKLPSTSGASTQPSTPSDERPSNASGPTAARPPAIPELSHVNQTLKEAQIDSHFPFDPYKLPLSVSYIQGIYRNWDSGGLDDEDSSSETSEDEEVSTADDADVLAGSLATSSLNDSDIKGFLAPAARPLGLRGVIDPALLSGSEDEDHFSKSFEAMSVSPRRTSLIAGM